MQYFVWEVKTISNQSINQSVLNSSWTFVLIFFWILVFLFYGVIFTEWFGGGGVVSIYGKGWVAIMKSRREGCCYFAEKINNFFLNILKRDNCAVRIRVENVLMQYPLLVVEMGQSFDWDPNMSYPCVARKDPSMLRPQTHRTTA